MDNAAIILDKNDQECVHENDIPNGQDYTDKVIIETDDIRSMTCALYKVKYKLSIYDLKYGKRNIMQYSTNHNGFLEVSKFKTSIKAAINCLSCQQTKPTLKIPL